MAGAVSAAVQMFTGERAVVFLFIARVLFAVPLGLVFEAVGLVLLAVAGLGLEISFESSSSIFQRFKTRPGASSGILLGTVTLPTVMLSRLIQLSRALSSNEIANEEFAYTALQYWAVCASCFGVLVFIFTSLQETSECKDSLIGSSRASRYNSLYVISFIIIFSLSYVTKSYDGLELITKLSWLFCHGIATTALIRHILFTFPACSSIGEALLVASGLVLYISDMVALTLSKINYSKLSLGVMFSEYGRRTESSTITQGILLGLLLFPAFYKSILQTWTYLIKRPSFCSQDGKPWADMEVLRSIIFYVSLSVMLIIIVPSWMCFVQNFDLHPLLWVVNFVFSDSLKRLALCVYWVAVISASVMRFYNISKHSKIERILLRKYYHLVAVLMFVPAVLLQPTFLDLAFGSALSAFLILEMIRVWEIWPLGQIINQFMNAFTDHRDSEILIVSHFSLLLGCALPKWLSSGFNDRPLAPFAGILSLGIGDTMASMVGHKYGVLRWSKTGKKTIEGTAAGITSVLAACSVLLPLLASTGFILSQHWFSLLIAVTASGLLEAYTAQLDNAFIPLIFFSLLCL